MAGRSSKMEAGACFEDTQGCMKDNASRKRKALEQPSTSKRACNVPSEDVQFESPEQGIGRIGESKRDRSLCARMKMLLEFEKEEYEDSGCDSYFPAGEYQTDSCRANRQKIPMAEVFRPSAKEFKDFHSYLRKIAPKVIPNGICKIIPPPGWKPKCSIPKTPFTCVCQTISAQIRNAAQINAEKMKEKISFKDFLHKTSSDWKAPSLNEEEVLELETKYWDRILSRENDLKMLYANDQEFSSFPSPDKFTSDWNLLNVPHLPQGLLQFSEMKIPGITFPFSYLGSKFTTFCWHMEDDQLYSLNYLHEGQPKFWYGIPASSDAKFEELFRTIFPIISRKYSLDKRTTVIDPGLIRSKNIPVSKVIQKRGEFVVTFPGAYHTGFNTGLNLAEAVNFADDLWLCNAINVWKYKKIYKEIPVVPFSFIVVKAAEAIIKSEGGEYFIPQYRHDFTEGIIKRHYESLYALVSVETTNRDRLHSRYRDMPVVCPSEWPDVTLAYCDCCKEFLYLNLVQVKCKDSENMYCPSCYLDECAESIKKENEKEKISVKLLEHFPCRDLWVMVKQLYDRL